MKLHCLLHNLSRRQWKRRQCLQLLIETHPESCSQRSWRMMNQTVSSLSRENLTSSITMWVNTIIVAHRKVHERVLIIIQLLYNQSRYPLGLWPWQVELESTTLAADEDHELQSLSWSQSKRYRFARVTLPGHHFSSLARRRTGRGGR